MNLGPVGKALVCVDLKDIRAGIGSSVITSAKRLVRIEDFSFVIREFFMWLRGSLGSLDHSISSDLDSTSILAAMFQG